MPSLMLLYPETHLLSLSPKALKLKPLKKEVSIEPCMYMHSHTKTGSANGIQCQSRKDIEHINLAIAVIINCLKHVLCQSAKELHWECTMECWIGNLTSLEDCLIRYATLKFSCMHEITFRWRFQSWPLRNTMLGPPT